MKKMYRVYKNSHLSGCVMFNELWHYWKHNFAIIWTFDQNPQILHKVIWINCEFYYQAVKKMGILCYDQRLGQW